MPLPGYKQDTMVQERPVNMIISGGEAFFDAPDSKYAVRAYDESAEGPEPNEAASLRRGRGRELLNFPDDYLAQAGNYNTPVGTPVPISASTAQGA